MGEVSYIFIWSVSNRFSPKLLLMGGSMLSKGIHTLENRRKLIQICLGMFMLCYYVHFIHLKTLWYDEAVTRLVASNSVGKNISNFWNGFDPYHSLYYTIVHFLTLPFDYSLISIRMISVFATLATISGIITFCTGILSFEIGLVASILFAFSPVVLDYATEARSTALVTASVIWSLIYLNRYLEGQSGKRLTLFTCIVVLNCYLSIFTVLYWPLYFLYFYSVKHKIPKLKNLFLALVAAIFAIFPLIYASMSATGRTDWIAQDYKLINSMMHFGGLPFRESEILNFNYVPIFLAIFWLIFCVNFGQRLFGSKDKLSNALVSFFLVWSALPAATLIIFSLIRPTYLNRYVIASIPGLMILFVVCLQSFSKRIIQVPLIVLVIAVSIYQAFTPSMAQQSKDHWKQFSAPLRLNAIPGDSIIFDRSCSGFFYTDALGDSTFSFNLVKVENLDLDSWITTPERVKSLRSVSTRIWVTSIGEASNSVKEALNSNGYRTQRNFAYPDGQRLWLYEKIG